MLIDCLNHVENGQRRRGDGGERLHLYAGDAAGLHGRLNTHEVGATLKVHRDLTQGQRVAEGNDFRGALSAHDAGNACNGKSIALGQIGIKNHGDNVFAGAHGRLSQGGAGGNRLLRNIHHVRRAVGAHMGQFLVGLRGRGHRFSWLLRGILLPRIVT